MASSKKEEHKQLRSLYSKLNKTNRCQTYAKNRHIPNSYMENTLKEELVLEHLIQYKKEFSSAIDPKRDLLLYPMNECKKYKFICTTIRPTKVPYPELYDYEKCAKFLSDFIEYEELNPPNEFPKYIPSPENVLLWQIGDCFDISIALCSLLIGSGYNAFVVYGNAPRYITIKDQTNLDCPDFPDDIKVIEPDLTDTAEESDIKIVEYKKKIISQFENDLQKQIEEDERQRWIEDNVINDDQPELERYDPWNKKRIHCWVLIKKNKRIDTSLFIEPASGRIYPIENSPFEKVDAVFNNINFWINLLPEKPINELDFNLLNQSAWEYVMLGTKESDEVEEADLEQDKTREDTIQSILDMPPHWPNKLYISSYAYHNRIPVPTQTFYFKRTKVDKYSPYSQCDGKVLVIYKYLDYARLRLYEVETRYRHRTDKLYKSYKYPYQHKEIEYYLPGQEYGWKTIEKVEALYKTINYYETNYDTGLIYRHEVYGKEITHKYKSRDDKVIERKVTFEPNLKGEIKSKEFELDSALYKSKLLITEFIQKYTVNPLVPPEQQIQKLVFLFSQSNFEMRLTYHFAKGKIKAETEKFYDKENESSMGGDDRDENMMRLGSDKEKLKKRLILIKTDSIGSFIKIEERYNEQLCKNSEYLKKIYEFSKGTSIFKGDIFKNHILEKHLFDKEIDETEKTSISNQDYSGIGHRFDRIEYFVKLEKEKREKSGLGKDNEEIKKAVINVFKEEKMQVTNILQTELKMHMANLNKEIDEFKNKDNITAKDIEEHNRKINDIQRVINIIYQRSHRHIIKIMEELNVLMTTLDEKI